MSFAHTCVVCTYCGPRVKSGRAHIQAHGLHTHYTYALGTTIMGRVFRCRVFKFSLVVPAKAPLANHELINCSRALCAHIGKRSE